MGIQDHHYLRKKGNGGMPPSAATLKYLTVEEVARLRQGCRLRAEADLARGRRSGVREWMLIDLLLGTGVRASELTALNVGDVDLAGENLRVRTLKRRQPCYRLLPIPHLKRHLAQFIKWKESCGEPLDGRAPLLSNARGRRYGLRGIQSAFARAARRAGLRPELTVHATRHTFGVFHYRECKDLLALKKLLGHAHLANTMIYADVLQDDLRRGMEGLYAGHGEPA